MDTTVCIKPPLAENILFVEGISRSGKFLVSNLLAGISEVEPVQYLWLLEQIPVLNSRGLIEDETAKEIARCELDLHCYELLIGRNLNHRKSDKSSIFNYPDVDLYLERCNHIDGDAPIQKFWKEQRFAQFILHESMNHIEFYLSAFHKAKIISIVRSPADLAYSWYKRGLGCRWGKDPKLFQITFSYKTVPVPWFIYPLAEDYLSLSEVDRAIFSIIRLHRLAVEKYRSLSLSLQRRILITSFEHLMRNPLPEITRIGEFLQKEISVTIHQILSHEQLPNLSHLEEKERRLRELKAVANPKLYQELLQLDHLYFQGKLYPLNFN